MVMPFLCVYPVIHQTPTITTHLLQHLHMNITTSCTIQQWTCLSPWHHLVVWVCKATTGVHARQPPHITPRHSSWPHVSCHQVVALDSSLSHTIAAHWSLVGGAVRPPAWVWLPPPIGTTWWHTAHLVKPPAPPSHRVGAAGWPTTIGAALHLSSRGPRGARAACTRPRQHDLVGSRRWTHHRDAAWFVAPHAQCNGALMMRSTVRHDGRQTITTYHT